MDSNPFAAARDRAPEPPRPSPLLVELSPQQLVGALVLTIAASIARAMVPPTALLFPPLPPLVLIFVLLLLGVGVVVGRGSLPQAALWPTTLAMPLFLWTIDLPAEPQLAPVALSIDLIAFDFLWVSIVGGLVTAAWLGVPVRSLVGFLAKVGLKVQLVTLGWQFFLPGLALSLLLALYEVAAARGEGWASAMQGIVRAPSAWLVRVGGMVLAALVGLAAALPWGLEAAQAAFLDASSTDFSMRLAMDLPAALIQGATLVIAARLYVPAKGG